MSRVDRLVFSINDKHKFHRDKEALLFQAILKENKGEKIFLIWAKDKKKALKEVVAQVGIEKINEISLEAIEPSCGVIIQVKQSICY